MTYNVFGGTLSLTQSVSLSCGCSSDMEQSATIDQGRLLTTDIPDSVQVSPFPSVK